MRNMKIALAGYGGVGQAFVGLLKEKEGILAAQGLHIQLNYILESYGGIYQPTGIIEVKREDFQPHITWQFALEQGDMDLLVLATPTNKQSGEPGMSYIKEALRHGLDVVSADKGPVFLDYHGLKAISRQEGTCLAIGCTTGGALPSINGGLIELAGAEILSIEGVLNGTCNFILEQMSRYNQDYHTALAEAQRLGLAEADPTLDVEGYDTAIKLLILSNVLLGQANTLADMKICGISSLKPEDISQARQQGYKYKLLGRARRQEGKLELTVGPEALAPQHPFYMVDGQNKAVRYETDSLGDLTLMISSSGTRPAAASLLRDIVNIHNGYRF